MIINFHSAGFSEKEFAIVEGSKEKGDKHHEIILSKSLYEKEAVFSAAYLLSGKCGIKIESEPEDFYKVHIELLECQREIDFKEIERKFNNELVDQQLRLDLEKRYGGIRELIIKHAFAPLENLKAETKKLVGRE